MGIEDKVNAAISHDLRVYARRRWPLANDKFRKDRLATLLRMTGRRIKSLYEGEQSAVIREHEAEAVRQLIGQEEANRNAFQDLQARISRLEATLLHQDEEFHHEQVAALRFSADGRRRGHVANAADGLDGFED